MKTFFLNLAVLIGAVLLAIAYVRWGGDADAESLRSRGEHAYKFIVAVCVISGLVWLITRKRRQ